MPSANVNTDQTNLGPKVAASTHPLYQLFQPTWVQLSHVREGTGGFLSTANDSYIVPHPREWLDHSTKQTETAADGTSITTVRTNPNPKVASPKLKARRNLARYENVASAIMEAKKSVLFREQPTRRVGKADQSAPAELMQWWDDVDGIGTCMDDAMPAWWDLGGSFGHLVLYFDVGDAPNPSNTAADQGWPYVRAYTPLDVLDWHRDENGALDYIKLLEAIEPIPTNETRGATTFRVRIVDRTSWRLYDYKRGAFIDKGDHDLGVVPVVFLFGKRRALLPDIGESVLGDPRNYIDLFNLTSEIRELLRNQTFSFINLPLGSGDAAMTVQDAQAMMGQQTGTMNVLFSAMPAAILTGDPSNIQSYHDEIARVKREIYRETGVQWEADTKGVEAQGSLEVKREDMTTRIAAYADECEQAEFGLAALWYRWRYGADVGPQKLIDDEVTIHYPEHFAKTPFQDVLDQAQAAMSIGMPAVFLKELRKALVAKFDGMGNLTPDLLQQINDAIDQAPDDLTPAEQMKARTEALAKAFAAGGGQPGNQIGQPGRQPGGVAAA